MTDFFALLGLPRRPGLDEQALQERYLRLASAWHPDAPGGDVEKFRALQDARKTLRDPASRIRHLLALEHRDPAESRRTSPPGDLFLEVAGVLEAAGKVTSRLQAAHSAIARAGLAADRLAAGQKIARAMDRVARRREERLRQIGECDAAWPEADLALLEEIGAELVFLARWEKELRDRLFQLQNPSAA